MAGELGLNERVKFVGRADRKLVASLFAGCAFFVLPSRHEPFGIVNLEAMAAGKAVVATRVGGAGNRCRWGDGVAGGTGKSWGAGCCNIADGGR
jgi:glycosyltransferase involved in cell wall biosynthesis